MHEHHRYPDDFEIGDRVRSARFNMRGVVTGHDEYGCVLVNVAKHGSRKVIRPFKPEFLEKE